MQKNLEFFSPPPPFLFFLLFVCVYISDCDQSVAL